ncbi:MAG: DUF1116 domain-containing protein [Pseudomonas sp.]
MRQPGQDTAAANALALSRLLDSQPTWIDVVPAIEILPGMTRETILHAGPPIAWSRMCGPQRLGVLDAIRYEGLADTDAQAADMIADGRIEIAPCHDFGTVGGMAGITSASMPLAVVRNDHHGNLGCSQLYQGPRGRLSERSQYRDAAIAQWRWLATTLGPALGQAIRARGGLDVRRLCARALQMGDECHNRNSAGSALLLMEIAPWLLRLELPTAVIEDCLRYLCEAEQFALCLSMAAAKAATDAAKHVPGSTLVTTMARNGVDFGIKLSGLGERWFTAPANPVEGLYFSSEWSDADAVPDMGDSAIMETYGLGGHVQAAAPALQQFVGGDFARGLRICEEMRRITQAENRDYQIPNLDFGGAPTGIDAAAVVRTGITPVIDTAIAHRAGGVIGAGQTRAPLDCFASAMASFQ